MDGQRAKDFFKQADELYNAGQYPQALKLLAELNSAFPNQKNVIWPSALCLAKLGRHEEAIRACEILVAQFGDARAADLRERLKTHQYSGATPPQLPTPDMLDGPIGLDAIDAMLDRPAAAPRVVREATPDYRKLGLIAGGIAAALFLLLLPMLGSGSADPATPAGAPTTVTEGQVAMLQELGVPAEAIAEMSPREAEITVALANLSLNPTEDSFLYLMGTIFKISDPTWGKVGIYFLLLSFLLSVFSYGPAMFTGLAILKKLPSDEILDNVTDVAYYTIMLSALAHTCIGLPAIPYIIAKHYELSIGETAICLAINAVVGGIIGWGLWQLFMMSLM